MCIFYRKKEKEKETNWHFLEFKFCKLTVIDGGEKGICCVFCFSWKEDGPKLTGEEWLKFCYYGQELL